MVMVTNPTLACVILLSFGLLRRDRRYPVLPWPALWNKNILKKNFCMFCMERHSGLAPFLERRIRMAMILSLFCIYLFFEIGLDACLGLTIFFILFSYL